MLAKAIWQQKTQNSKHEHSILQFVGYCGCEDALTKKKTVSCWSCFLETEAWRNPRLCYYCYQKVISGQLWPLVVVQFAAQSINTSSFLSVTPALVSSPEMKRKKERWNLLFLWSEAVDRVELKAWSWESRETERSDFRKKI